MNVKKRATTYILPEIGRPMLLALKILAPHFREMHLMWNTSMHDLRLDLDVGDIDELYSLTLEAHYVNLRAGNSVAYRLALARCGESLDRRGVPPFRAMIALSLYLEICCAFLLNLNVHNIELTIALAHFSSASQALVIAGYSKQHSTNLLRLVEGERRRLSQDLHDEIGHNLIVLKLYIELMARDYKKGRKEDVVEKLEEAMLLVSHSINSVRRLVLDLGPAALDKLELLPSFKVYAGQFSARTGIKVEVRGKVMAELPHVYATALYRVFQGALSNVAKHSKANKVQVTASTVKGSIVRMTIEDNGIGFVTKKLQVTEKFGLTAMQERIERFGGQFNLISRPTSSKDRPSGTRIDVELPMNEGKDIPDRRGRV
jgi:signal transduction histidine kinase